MIFFHEWDVSLEKIHFNVDPVYDPDLGIYNKIIVIAGWVQL